MNKKLIDFCERWMIKASSYGDDSLSDRFDKFFTLFVVYNALYDDVSKKMFASNKIQKDKLKDRKSATENVPGFIGHSFLAKSLKENVDTELAIQKIVRLIDGGEFYVHRKDRTDMPDHQKDRILIDRLKPGGSEKEFVESIIDLIYTARCNMFHGVKGYEEAQREILEPMISILNKIIDVLLKKYQENDMT